ncbi:MAG: FecR domain-containing protein [Chitinophagaceae bacterium]|nr:FecR domain-containing protein [Chitinophagaceae bacterium]
MDQEEYLKLAEKYMSGGCTPEEEALLKAYEDHIRLSDEDWDPAGGEPGEIYNELKSRLDNSVSRDVRPVRSVYFWMKIAAVLLIFLGANVLIKKMVSVRPARQETFSKPPVASIVPGGNNAYLTLSDGVKIPLNDRQNGTVTTEQGINIDKTRDGLLVYHAGEGNEATGSNHYNTITTPAGGQYQVVLSDSTRVWLNAGSSLKFPVLFDQQSRQVEVTGEAYFEVSGDKKRPFIVKTDKSEIVVLGTHFNVSAYQDDPVTTTTLLEGAVNVKHGAVSAILKPGQKSSVTADDPRITVEKADIQAAVAWKNGLFIFRDENIVSVMKKVARWYNVEVDYRGDVKNKSFGGTVSRFQNITEFLDILELAGEIQYKIEGRKVIIGK